MTILSYAMVGTLTIALVIAAVTDLRRRRIDNWLNATVFATAPLYWLASGAEGGVIAVQIAIAAAILVVLAPLFLGGVVGDGDVKLLAGLALWVPPHDFGRLLLFTAMAVGTLALLWRAKHRLRGRAGQPLIPYGVAIAVAGLSMLAGGHLAPPDHGAPPVIAEVSRGG